MQTYKQFLERFECQERDHPEQSENIFRIVVLPAEIDNSLAKMANEKGVPTNEHITQLLIDFCKSNPKWFGFICSN